jgi:hypothetical protein
MTVLQKLSSFMAAATAVNFEHNHRENNGNPWTHSTECGKQQNERVEEMHVR